MSSMLWGLGGVTSTDTHHDTESQPSSRQGDERKIVSLSLTHFAGVVSPGERIPERGEGRTEQRPIESFITPSRGMLTAY